ncbi:MAG TPA: TMEM175 family protein [Rhodanobacteraceae bacterium]|nr:TMEM175 family protein [Rhodanobacteraceae bacterium]
MTATTTLLDHGFRIRGVQPTRVDAFVDAAFAFAVTLLVIAIGRVPASVAELVQAMRGVPAFAASFFVIGRLWQAHRNWSRHYGIEDVVATRLSLALVFMVLVYVYPLRMVAELTLAGISGGALAETPVEIHTVTELRTLYVVFGLGYLLTALIFLALYSHAMKLADAIGLTPAERIRTTTLCLRWKAVIAIAVASVLLGLFLPMGRGESMPLDSAPGLVYILVYVAFQLLARRERRQLAAIGSTA